MRRNVGDWKRYFKQLVIKMSSMIDKPGRISPASNTIYNYIIFVKVMLLFLLKYFKGHAIFFLFSN